MRKRLPRIATLLGAALLMLSGSPNVAEASPPYLVETREGYERVAGTGRRVGSGPLRTYTVELERRIGVDHLAVAAFVDETLANPKSWIGDGSVSFQRVDEKPSFRVVLATPRTVDHLCRQAGLSTVGRYSCWNGEFVALNLDRWKSATSHWPASLEQYRGYLVNHEIGHALGHGHRACPGEGRLAPVMQQQTVGLDGCRPNPWPFPERAGEAPSSARFLDIGASTHHDTILEMAASGIAKGCAERAFCPDLPVRRDQSATFLARVFALPTAGINAFTDDTGNIHEANINAIAVAEITTGCAVGRYCPTDVLSRAEAASLLTRAFALPPTEARFFADVGDGTHADTINRVAAAKITVGCAHERFCPDQSVTRAQMATMLSRALTHRPTAQSANE